MIRSAVTVSLVEEARGGPFVYHDDLAEACRKARAHGFDGVEVFPSNASAVDPARLRILLNDHGLALAAVGTGAGWLKQRLSLVDPDVSVRVRARDFVRAIIDFAGPFHAPAIIGSMQGRSGPGLAKPTALGYLADALEDLGEYARPHGVPLLLEPLNRYETDLVNTLEGGIRLLGSLSTANVRLLADLFHMNIEETHMAESILSARPHIGHVHFVDSNRRAAGLGHIDYPSIVKALRASGFGGFASAEALPLPDPETAAARTIQSFRRLFRDEGPTVEMPVFPG